jgi:pimeloyl-ACP methyl ester carboxylesterase
MQARLTNEFKSRHGLARYGVSGTGPAVILQHGTPTSSVIWSTVIERLSERYTLYYADLPGYGASAKFEGQDVRLRAFAQTVRDFAVHLHLERPHLVGHDFGAAAVLGAHLVEGLDVSSITVVDGVVLSPWGTPFSRHVKAHERVFAAVPAYVHEAILEAHLKTAAARIMDATTLRSLVEPWTGAEGQRAYYRQVGQYDYEYTERLERLYPKLVAPLAIIWGEEDRWVSISEGQRLRRLIPHASFEALPDAGHFCMIDVPHLLANVLHASLAHACRAGTAGTGIAAVAS